VTTETPQAIAMEFDLPNAPAVVWRALTDSELLAAWMMPNDFVPTLGHHFTLQGKPNPHFDGVIRCEVLAIEPETRLSYTWNGGGLNSVLTWTLEPSASGGTTLRLHHDGFLPKDQMAFDGIRQGWGKVVERLTPVLATL
jgi:uncharacterized protein YndB with AHSA1/START domain